MVDLQELAQDLRYDAYESPVNSEKSVWSVKEKPDVKTLVLSLDVQDNVVTAVNLTTGLTARVPWTPDTYMESLSTRRALIAILDSDPCLCKTMWRIVPAGAGYTLEDTGDLPDGCCPTLAVPAAGSTLTPSFFVPSAVLRSATKSTTGWQLTDGCRKGGNAAILYDKGKVVAVQRELQVQITWTISAWLFDELEIEMHRIIEMAPGLSRRSDTLNLQLADVFQCGGQTTTNLLTGVRPVVPVGLADCVLAKALQAWKNNQLEGLGADDAWKGSPGCISVAPSTGYSKWTKPWREPTCSGEPCDGKQRVYCNTFQWLNRMAGMLRKVLCPARTFETWNWDEETTLVLTASNTTLHTLSVIKGSSLIIKLDKETSQRCGSGPDVDGGSSLTLQLHTRCTARKFQVGYTITANDSYQVESGSSCPGPTTGLGVAEAFVGFGFTWSGGWKYTAGIGLNPDACSEEGEIDFVKFCSTGSANIRQGDDISPYINGAAPLTVRYADFSYAAISMELTITPVIE